jgi:hypothetical protein
MGRSLFTQWLSLCLLWLCCCLIVSQGASELSTASRDFDDFHNAVSEQGGGEGGEKAEKGLGGKSDWLRNIRGALHLLEGPTLVFTLVFLLSSLHHLGIASPLSLVYNVSRLHSLFSSLLTLLTLLFFSLFSSHSSLLTLLFSSLFSSLLFIDSSLHSFSLFFLFSLLFSFLIRNACG